MDDYIAIKPSQLSLYKNIPLYYLSKDGEGVLFKKTGVFLDKSQLLDAKDMEIFIQSRDKDSAAKELLTTLNMDLAKKIASKGVRAVRSVLCDIVEEAITGSLDNSSQTLPETIEILFQGYSRKPELFKALIEISTNSHITIEHSVNVLSLSMLYCCFHEISVNATKKIGIAALLHDIGTTQIDGTILDSEQKLSEKEFNIYKTHPFKGHDAIKNSPHFDEIVAVVALEHHEKLDGSGYPRGITDISFESQLIGLIDSYEPLTYRDKAFRKAQKPYNTLTLLKEEVVAKKYNKDIFKKLCACLTK
jgi:HD-GYP domain-containing protein (c-di-GMP phosphodiesterase class II)